MEFGHFKKLMYKISIKPVDKTECFKPRATCLPFQQKNPSNPTLWFDLIISYFHFSIADITNHCFMDVCHQHSMWSPLLHVFIHMLFMLPKPHCCVIFRLVQDKISRKETEPIGVFEIKLIKVKTTLIVEKLQKYRKMIWLIKCVHARNSVLYFVCLVKRHWTLIWWLSVKVFIK